MKFQSIFQWVAFAAMAFLPWAGLAQEKNVADYQTLSDGSVSISAGNFKTFPVTLPSNFVVGTNKARPMLQFKARATSGTPIVKVELNDGQQYSLKLPSNGTVTAAYEVIYGTKFDTSGGNTIQFRAQGGNIQVADVVLWYQIKVPD